MRAAWERFGHDERPYTMQDLRAILRDMTGDSAFVEEFFGKYVEGREVPDFQRLLGRAGYTLRPAAPERPWIGLTSVAFEAEGARLTGPSLIGTPLYDAGVGTGDLIVEIGGRPVGNEADLTAAVASHSPGTRVPIRYRQRGEERQTELTVMADPRLEVVPGETAGGAASAGAREFRAGWLESRVPR
jgi:predicted metalloprotease with PDZ domain